MNWNDMLASAGTQYHDADELKKNTAMAYVLEMVGHPVSEVDGKVSGTCPFHDDDKPSFDLFGEELDRWGCYPCADNGDIFDLVGKLYGIPSFVARKDKVAEILESQKAIGWNGLTKGVKRRYDKDEGERIFTASQDGSNGAWMSLYDDLAARNVGIKAADADQIQLDFQLGGSGVDTVIPYFNRNMDLVAYKRRRAGGKPMAAAGADFSEVLYGEWLDNGTSAVLLCEGESDVWAARTALPGWSVLGLPTGAGSHPRQAHSLSGRNVVLAFDGDATGRAALRNWFDALQGVAESVRIIIMPDDVDVASIADLPSAVRGAVAVPPSPNRISIREDGIYTVARSEKQEAEALSNFTIEPIRYLEGDSGMNAWECTMSTTNNTVVITIADLQTKGSMVKWAGPNGGSWYGSDMTVQYLQSWLQARQPFLAAGSFTTVAGLHDEHYVFPGGSIGPDHWVYAPGNNDVQMGSYLKYLTPDGEWDFANQLRLMRSLHDTSVMDPILAWLALAPIRSLISPFPTLAVLGGSGTGKTTLLETILRAFTGSEIGVNLASTTPYAIQAMTASTNSFPVWFDEYRPGARKDTLVALDQIVRDAYNGHGSIKGGMGEHWAQIRLLRSECPLIVSGEDAFTETSHLERIVPIYLPMEGRNPEALTALQNQGPTPFAHKWMEILRYAMVTGTLNTTVTPMMVDGLNPRVQNNLGVLRLGWDLLADYAQRISNVDLGDPDWSLVSTIWDAESKTSPVLDALKWVSDEPNAVEFFKVEDDLFYLRVENFVKYIQRHGSFVLPGNTKAVHRILTEQYGAVQARTYIYGATQVRALALPMSLLNDV